MAELAPTALSRARLLALGGLALYVALRLIAFLGASPLEEGDTPDYRHVAGLSVFDPDFYANVKPWALPLLYKLLPGDGLRTVGQLLISIAAWSVLAAVVASLVRDLWLRIAAVVLVLALSLTWPVIWWDRVLLGESLSISLAVLVLAALLAFAERPGRGRVALVLAAALLAASVRDTNAFLVLLLLVPIALATATVRPHRGLAAAMLAGALLIAATSQLSARAGDRWEVPSVNVVGGFILPNPEATEYFRAHGMPLTPALREQTGKSGPPMIEAVRGRPELGSFRVWLREEGQGTYVRWLVSDLRHSVSEVIRSRDRLFGRQFNATSSHRPADLDDGVPHLLPGSVERVLYPNGRAMGVLWLLLCGGAAAFAAWRGGARRTWLVPLTALTATLLLAFVIWHGDYLEPERHALLVSLLSRLSPMVLLVLAVDALARGRAAGP